MKNENLGLRITGIRILNGSLRELREFSLIPKDEPLHIVVGKSEQAHESRLVQVSPGKSNQKNHFRAGAGWQDRNWLWFCMKSKVESPMSKATGERSGKEFTQVVDFPHLRLEKTIMTTIKIKIEARQTTDHEPLTTDPLAQVVDFPHLRTFFSFASGH